MKLKKVKVILKRSRIFRFFDKKAKSPSTSRASGSKTSAPMLTSSKVARIRSGTSLHKNEHESIDVAEIIFAIPRQVMNTSVKLPVNEYGSNILHVACRRGTTTHAVCYIFDNCRPDTKIYLLQQPDHEGNLPIHSLVSCLCRDQMPLDDGLKILEIFHKIWPESVFELNSDEKLVTDIIIDCQRKKDDESDEFKKLDQLRTNLRNKMIKVWQTKQKIREEERKTVKTAILTLANKFGNRRKDESMEKKVSSTNAMKNHSTDD